MGADFTKAVVAVARADRVQAPPPPVTTVTVPALAYTLNVANANSNLNEVLARPTLAAVEGMRSEFFSGTSLNAAVVSNSTSGGGSAVSLERRYGVKLTVQPQILPDGRVHLAIDAARTFAASRSPDHSQRWPSSRMRSIA